MYKIIGCFFLSLLLSCSDTTNPELPNIQGLREQSDKYYFYGEYEKSYQLLDSIITLGYKGLKLYNEMGLSCWGVEKYEQGEEFFQLALPLAKTRSDSLMILNNLTGINIAAGKFEDAFLNTQKYMGICVTAEDSLNGIYFNVEVLEKTGKMQKSKELLDMAEKRFFNDSLINDFYKNHLYVKRAYIYLTVYQDTLKYCADLKKAIAFGGGEYDMSFCE